MKLVILDAYTANPGDLSWETFRKLGDCEIHERTSLDQVLSRATAADILVTNKTVLDRKTILALPRLKYIGVLATGYDVVDAQAARERNIPVTNVPGYGSMSVAQAVFALLLELTNRTGHHAQTVRESRWSKSIDWCYWDFPLIELSGLTLGLVGFGKIGQAVARIARAFGMNVVSTRRNLKRSAEAGVEFISLDELFSRSDVVSLHCPLTPQTKGMVNAKRLAQMKSSALLINTARGGLVNEPDLVDALNSARIAGAGLDVLSEEPPPASNPLLRANNCAITPHIAWATQSARQRLLAIAAGNIEAFLAGTPKNVVN